MDKAWIEKEMRYWVARAAAMVLSERQFVCLKGLIRTGKWPELDNPVSINDKMRWLMLNHRDERLHQLVDKYRVRDFVRERIGHTYLTELYDVYENVRDINFNALPERFILKTNHASGWNVVCLDKNQFDARRARNQLNKWMNRDYWDHTREWAYKGVPRRILWEQFLYDPEQGGLPRDYKIHCFHGEPKFIQVFEDMDSDLKRNLYDCEWNQSPITEGLPECKQPIEKPKKLQEMLWVARKLSEGLPYVRVDLYYVREQIYFGEMTIYHDSANSRYKTREMEKEIGNWLDLEEIGR